MLAFYSIYRSYRKARPLTSIDLILKFPGPHNQDKIVYYLGARPRHPRLQWRKIYCWSWNVSCWPKTPKPQNPFWLINEFNMSIIISDDDEWNQILRFLIYVDAITVLNVSSNYPEYYKILFVIWLALT